MVMKILNAFCETEKRLDILWKHGKNTVLLNRHLCSVTALFNVLLQIFKQNRIFGITNAKLIDFKAAKTKFGIVNNISYDCVKIIFTLKFKLYTCTHSYMPSFSFHIVAYF